MKEHKPTIILVGLSILLIFILYFTLSIPQQVNNNIKSNDDIPTWEMDYDELIEKYPPGDTINNWTLDAPIDTYIIREKHYPSGDSIIDTLIINK
tara:strand:- start:3 stop:287 length:285 start_codon:yes stop_codon:yes gene_type:complete